MRAYDHDFFGDRLGDSAKNDLFFTIDPSCYFVFLHSGMEPITYKIGFEEMKHRVILVKLVS